MTPRFVIVLTMIKQSVSIFKLNICHEAYVLGMTFKCIHIFIVTGSFLYFCFIRAGQSAFLHTQLYLSTNLDHILFRNVSWH